MIIGIPDHYRNQFRNSTMGEGSRSPKLKDKKSKIKDQLTRGDDSEEGEEEGTDRAEEHGEDGHLADGKEHWDDLRELK